MSTRTYYRLSVSVALGAVLGALLIHAPEARADARGFITEMIGMGFTHTDGASGLLRLGYAVCEMLSTPGYDGYDVAREVYVSTGWDIDRTDSNNIVIIAVEQLCPEFDNRSNAVA